MESSRLGSVAREILQRRVLVVAAIAVVVAGAGAMIPRLTADFSPQQLFAQFEDQLRVARTFREKFGSTENIIIAIVEAEDVLEREPLGYLHDIGRHFAGSDNIAHVASITLTPIPRRPGGPAPKGDDTPIALRMLRDIASGALRVTPLLSGDDISDEELAEARNALADAPLIEGKLLSRDRTVAAAAIVLDDNSSKIEQLTAVVTRVEQYVSQNPPPPGVSVRLGGLPVIRATLVRKMRADQTVLLPTAFGICLLILLLTFRWLPGVLLPMGSVAITVVVLVGTMAAVGEPFNIINNIVPLLVVIIGISNSIHLLSRYGEELGRGYDREDACRRALRRMIVACFLTSFTTAVGFASLAVSQTELLRRFGFTAAAGVLIAYVVSMTFVPAFLTWVKRPRVLAKAAHEGLLERGTVPVLGFLLRHQVLILIGSLAALALAGYAATQLRVDSALLDQFEEEEEVYQTLKLVESKLDGIRPLEVLLTGEKEDTFTRPEVIAAIERVEAWAVEQDGVLSATGYSDLLRETWYAATGDPAVRSAPFPSGDLVNSLTGVLRQQPKSPLKAFLASDDLHARLNIQLADIGAEASMVFGERLLEQLAAELKPFPEVSFDLTGEGHMNASGLRAVAGDLLSSLLLAVVVIFGFIAVILRDIKLGLLSIPPNLLPLIGTMAYMHVRGIPLNIANVIIFSISIGMAVDATIHLLARFTEEIRDGHSREIALTRAARKTGKAILVTCATLMIGFSSMQLSSFLPVRRFGELIAITIGGCLVATLLVLPPLINAFWRPTRAQREAMAIERGPEETDR